jgi:O-antigen ligase
LRLSRFSLAGMSTRETIIFLIAGFGTLAMTIGAFGLLAALERRSRDSRWALPLIGSYALGIAMIVTGLTIAGAWYFAAPLALMLVPVEVALRRHGLGRRTADLSHFK